MLALLSLHPLLRRFYERLRPLPAKIQAGFINGKAQTSAGGEARMEQRISFDFGFALAFLTALHGFSMFKIIAILYLNYCIATKLPRKYVVGATWAFNICVLFANELASGYKYAKLEQILSEFMGATDLEFDKNGLKVGWGKWMDDHGGIMPRWEILFNLTVLRLISFNIDYYWSQDGKSVNALEVCFYFLSLVIIHPSNSKTQEEKPRPLEPLRERSDPHSSTSKRIQLPQLRRLRHLCAAVYCRPNLHF